MILKPEEWEFLIAKTATELAIAIRDEDYTWNARYEAALRLNERIGDLLTEYHISIQPVKDDDEIPF